LEVSYPLLPHVSSLEMLPSKGAREPMKSQDVSLADVQNGQSDLRRNPADFVLNDGSRVAVIGGGPAGSFFSYFLLEMAKRIGVDVGVDIYESRDFAQAGPAGCNMCGGVISESLVQHLAAEGINLPSTVVKRGIDSYVMHMDVGQVRIETPGSEQRIAAVHRGAGPRGTKESLWRSFDGYLLELAQNKGAKLVPGRVDGITYADGRPQVRVRGGEAQGYDLLVLASGVNSATLKLLEQSGLRYKPPKTTKTHIAEFKLGQEAVEKHLGSSMHVFLLNLPRLEFAALIPKGDHATLCLLGDDIDEPLVQSFLSSPEVRGCLPSDVGIPQDVCHCSPRISVSSAFEPFADRTVFIGDCGVTRLFKDGIGAAYRTAKAAAVTAIFEGVSAEDFRRYFRPACQKIDVDNKFGKVIFLVTRVIQKLKVARRGVLRMVSREQCKKGMPRRMSSVLWDTFTGSSPYKDIFFRTVRPAFLARLAANVAVGSVTSNVAKPGPGENDG